MTSNMKLLQYWYMYHLSVFYFAYQITFAPASASEIPKMILISMDGFRHDYFELHGLTPKETPNFHYFMDNGVRAKRIMNVWPANTYPNHMSILTGTYPEFHGVINNVFYDPYLNDTFNMNNVIQNLYGSEFFDNGAEPIWVTNDKHGSGRSSGSVFWPCSLAPVKCIRPRIIPNIDLFVNDSVFPFRDRVDRLIDWFTDDVYGRINLGLLYFPEPDIAGHRHGPYSQEVKDKILFLDGVLGYLKKKLEAKNLFDDMNIIITADHGMTPVFNDSGIDMDYFVNPEWYKSMTNFSIGVNPMIVPKPEHKEKVYSALFDKDKDGKYIDGKDHGKFHAWMKSGKEMKKRHFSKSRRIFDIILEAKKGYRFNRTGYSFSTTLRGNHGYNPWTVSDVLPFFIASGPAFKKGVVKETFDMVDIYPLMCHILEIGPAENNGDLENVKDLLTNPPVWYKTFETTAVSFIIVVIVAALVGGVFAIGVIQQSRKYRQRRQVTHRGATSRMLPETDSMLHDDDDDDL